MTRRLNGTLQDILTQTVDRIIAQIPKANESNCYITLDLESSPLPSPGEFIYLVKPGPGFFDDANWDGGGQEMATNESSLTVRIYSPQRLDQEGRDTALLTHGTLGVCEAWRVLIRELTEPSWSPTVEVAGETIEIFRDPLIPTSFDFGTNRDDLGYAQQSFRLLYDLDLS